MKAVAAALHTAGCDLHNLSAFGASLLEILHVGRHSAVTGVERFGSFQLLCSVFGSSQHLSAAVSHFHFMVNLFMKFMILQQVDNH